VAALHGLAPLRLGLRWDRVDPRRPGIHGLETLALDLDAPAPGRIYVVPRDVPRLEYGLASPALGQGARAVEVRGLIRLESWTADAARVFVDLRARMARIDAPGVAFDEAVLGAFTLPRREPDGLAANR
jgi:hypothetical protein